MYQQRKSMGKEFALSTDKQNGIHPLLIPHVYTLNYPKWNKGIPFTNRKYITNMEVN